MVGNNGERTVLQGVPGKPKETECVLVWDGKKFRLEKLGAKVDSLRHVREGEADESYLPGITTLMKLMC